MTTVNKSAAKQICKCCYGFVRNHVDRLMSFAGIVSLVVTVAALVTTRIGDSVPCVRVVVAVAHGVPTGASTSRARFRTGRFAASLHPGKLKSAVSEEWKPCAGYAM